MDQRIVKGRLAACARFEAAGVGGARAGFTPVHWASETGEGLVSAFGLVVMDTRSIPTGAQTCALLGHSRSSS